MVLFEGRRHDYADDTRRARNDKRPCRGNTVHADDFGDCGEQQAGDRKTDHHKAVVHTVVFDAEVIRRDVYKRQTQALHSRTTAITG